MIKRILIASLFITGTTLLLFQYINTFKNAGSLADNAQESFYPWRSIGGCGAGGSGGVARDGIKWLGEGVTGGFGELELFGRYYFGQDFIIKAVAPRFRYKLSWNNTIGITLPILSKHADVQLQTNMAPSHHITGGTGDIYLEYARTFGFQSQYTLNLGLSVPTGQFDIKRGRDAGKYFLPFKSLQKGTGTYNLVTNLSYIKDVEEGFWMIDVDFNFPFSMKLFSRENRYMDEYFSNYKGLKNDKRFYYTFKPYGENDLGDVSPMTAGFSVAYAYRGVEDQVHSIGFTYSNPISVGYINQVQLVNNQGSFAESVYQKAIVDPDFQRWNAAIVYGLELSREKLPVFLAVSIPIHAKTNEEDPTKWSGPDWKDLGQQWTFAVGLKASLF
jgi:hypothetical protein